MVCDKCKVVDENIFVFSFKGETPHKEFFEQFMKLGCKLCMSDRIYSGYRRKISRPRYYADDFIDMLMLRKMKIFISNDSNFNHCPIEFCSDRIESEKRFERVPREDRYLVTVSEFFQTFIVTEDDELYKAVNSDDGLTSRCKRSLEAIEALS